jgi:hypothetical protein
MEKNQIDVEIKKVDNIIKSIDGEITNNLVKCQHGSDDFMYNQRISNALLNVIRAIDVLKYEL